MIWMVYRPVDGGPALLQRDHPCDGKHNYFTIIEHANVGDDWTKPGECTMIKADDDRATCFDSERDARDMYIVELAAWRLTDGA